MGETSGGGNMKIGDPDEDRKSSRGPAGSLQGSLATDLSADWLTGSHFISYLAHRFTLLSPVWLTGLHSPNWLTSSHITEPADRLASPPIYRIS